METAAKANQFDADEKEITAEKVEESLTDINDEVHSDGGTAVTYNHPVVSMLPGKVLIHWFRSQLVE